MEGDGVRGLAGAMFRDRTTGETHFCPLRHLFLFIGADPNAGWLEDCVAVDGKGFVVTGADFAADAGVTKAGLAARDELAWRVRHRRCAGGLDQARCRGGRRGRRGRGANSQRACAA